MHEHFGAYGATTTCHLLQSGGAEVGFRLRVPGSFLDSRFRDLQVMGIQSRGLGFRV